jgi:heme/copper-type cytochrome/quinol oxidase subunit 2
MFNPKKTCLLVLALCTSTLLFAQQTTQDATEHSGMRSNNKIYVVVAVVVTILLGLIIYVARLDKKISKLEDGNK